MYNFQCFELLRKLVYLEATAEPKFYRFQVFKKLDSGLNPLPIQFSLKNKFQTHSKEAGLGPQNYYDVFEDLFKISTECSRGRRSVCLFRLPDQPGLSSIPF